MNQNLTEGICIAMICLGIGSCVYLGSKGEAEVERAQRAPIVHRENVLAGEKPETFYNIAGERAYVEIDGRPVEEYFRE